MTTILIADDSPIERKLVARLLASQTSNTLLSVANGQEAIDELERRGGEVDLLLSDLRMPVMGGMELLVTVRSRYPNLPVIIMTSRGSEEIAVQALQEGAASYITKSQLRDRLNDVVTSVLNANRRNLDLERVVECIEREELTIVLDNDRSRLPGVINYLQTAASRYDLCEERDFARLGIALEEALLNALTHGNLEVSSELRKRNDGEFDRLIEERRFQDPYQSRRIYVSCRLSREAVSFHIRDEGPGFNLSDLPDPTDPEHLLKPSGRGILLMRSFMDKLEYNAIGNEVTLTRFAGSETPAESPETSAKEPLLPV